MSLTDEEIASLEGSVAGLRLQNDVMTLHDASQVYRRYEERFDNFDEVGAMELLQDDRFVALVEMAIVRGAPLTREEIDAKIPDVAWEY